MFFCFVYRRRIHIQNVGQSGNSERHHSRQSSQRENAPSAAANAQNFHRNLIYSISEAVMDAFNGAQIPRPQGTESGNRNGASNANANATQSGRLPRVIPPFAAGLIPNIQDIVSTCRFCCCF